MDLTLNDNLAGSGYANTLALTINAWPDLTAASVFVDVWVRFEDEPDAEPLYLGRGNAGTTPQFAFESKGRTLRFFGASVTPDGMRLESDFSKMAQTVYTPDPSFDFGTPIEASEDMVAGTFVNIYSALGTPNIRKANATNNTKPCHGFIVEDVTIGNLVSVYYGGNRNVFLSSLTPGVQYFLSTTGGTLTATAPTASGNIQQQLGEAESDTTFRFEPQPTIEKR